MAEDGTAAAPADAYHDPEKDARLQEREMEKTQRQGWTLGRQLVQSEALDLGLRDNGRLGAARLLASGARIAEEMRHHARLMNRQTKALFESQRRTGETKTFGRARVRTEARRLLGVLRRQNRRARRRAVKQTQQPREATPGSPSSPPRSRFEIAQWIKNLLFSKSPTESQETPVETNVTDAEDDAEGSDSSRDGSDDDDASDEELDAAAAAMTGTFLGRSRGRGRGQRQRGAPARSRGVSSLHLLRASLSTRTDDNAAAAQSTLRNTAAKAFEDQRQRDVSETTVRAWNAFEEGHDTLGETLDPQERGFVGGVWHSLRQSLGGVADKLQPEALFAMLRSQAVYAAWDAALGYTLSTTLSIPLDGTSAALVVNVAARVGAAALTPVTEALLGRAVRRGEPIQWRELARTAGWASVETLLTESTRSFVMPSVSSNMFVTEVGVQSVRLAFHVSGAAKKIEAAAPDRAEARARAAVEAERQRSADATARRRRQRRTEYLKQRLFSVPVDASFAYRVRLRARDALRPGAVRQRIAQLATATAVVGTALVLKGNVSAAAEWLSKEGIKDMPLGARRWAWQLVDWVRFNPAMKTALEATARNAILRTTGLSKIPEAAVPQALRWLRRRRRRNGDKEEAGKWRQALENVVVSSLVYGAFNQSIGAAVDLTTETAAVKLFTSDVDLQRILTSENVPPGSALRFLQLAGRGEGVVGGALKTQFEWMWRKPATARPDEGGGSEETKTETTPPNGSGPETTSQEKTPIPEGSRYWRARAAATTPLYDGTEAVLRDEIDTDATESAADATRAFLGGVEGEETATADAVASSSSPPHQRLVSDFLANHQHTARAFRESVRRGALENNVEDVRQFAREVWEKDFAGSFAAFARRHAADHGAGVGNVAAASHTGANRSAREARVAAAETVKTETFRGGTANAAVEAVLASDPDVRLVADERIKTAKDAYVTAVQNERRRLHERMEALEPHLKAVDTAGADDALAAAGNDATATQTRGQLYEAQTRATSALDSLDEALGASQPLDLDAVKRQYETVRDATGEVERQATAWQTRVARVAAERAVQNRAAAWAADVAADVAVEESTSTFRTTFARATHDLGEAVAGLERQTATGTSVSDRQTAAQAAADRFASDVRGGVRRSLAGTSAQAAWGRTLADANRVAADQLERFGVPVSAENLAAAVEGAGRDAFETAWGDTETLDQETLERVVGEETSPVAKRLADQETLDPATARAAADAVRGRTPEATTHLARSLLNDAVQRALLTPHQERLDQALQGALAAQTTVDRVARSLAGVQANAALRGEVHDAEAFLARTDAHLQDAQARLGETNAAVEEFRTFMSEDHRLAGSRKAAEAFEERLKGHLAALERTAETATAAANPLAEEASKGLDPAVARFAQASAQRATGEVTSRLLFGAALEAVDSTTEESGLETTLHAVRNRALGQAVRAGQDVAMGIFERYAVDVKAAVAATASVEDGGKGAFQRDLAEQATRQWTQDRTKALRSASETAETGRYRAILQGRADPLADLRKSLESLEKKHGEEAAQATAEAAERVGKEGTFLHQKFDWGDSEVLAHGLANAADPEVLEVHAQAAELTQEETEALRQLHRMQQTFVHDEASQTNPELEKQAEDVKTDAERAVDKIHKNIQAKFGATFTKCLGSDDGVCQSRGLLAVGADTALQSYAMGHLASKTGQLLKKAGVDKVASKATGRAGRWVGERVRRSAGVKGLTWEQATQWGRIQATGANGPSVAKALGTVGRQQLSAMGRVLGPSGPASAPAAVPLATVRRALEYAGRRLTGEISTGGAERAALWLGRAAYSGAGLASRAVDAVEGFAGTATAENGFETDGGSAWEDFAARHGLEDIQGKTEDKSGAAAMYEKLAAFVDAPSSALGTHATFNRAEVFLSLLFESPQVVRDVYTAAKDVKAAVDNESWMASLMSSSATVAWTLGRLGSYKATAHTLLGSTAADAVVGTPQIVKLAKALKKGARDGKK